MADRNTEIARAMFPILQEAGEIAREYRRRSDADFVIKIKPDGSKVTGGDLAVHEFLAREIPKITPDIPVASEEDPASHFDYGDKAYWVLDPIDGTNNFINGRMTNSNDYAILAAIVQNRVPILGLVYGPQSNTFYMAGENTGALKQIGQSDGKKFEARQWEAGDIIRIGMNHYLEQSPYKNMLRDAFEKAGYHPQFARFEPTISRICAVAENIADVYAFGLETPAGEWDVASAHVILNESGGGFVPLDDPSRDVTYGNPARGVANVLAVNDPIAMRRILSLAP